MAKVAEPGEDVVAGVSPATASDLEALAVLDTERVGSRSAAEDLALELEREFSRLEVVRTREANLVAFINYWLVSDEVQLLKVATAPGFTRRGYARALMEHMFTVGRDAGCAQVHLELRESNQAAAALYRALGFREVAVRRGYYADNGEGAIVMLCDLQAGSSTPGSD